MTRLLALAASTRPNSFNRRLLAMAAHEAGQAGADVTLLDYADLDVPLFKDEEERSLPPGAVKLADALLGHDGLLLASPEYNWSMPGSLKNLIDWISIDPRSPFAGRTALLMSASPSTRGGIMGLSQLRVPLENLHMWVYPQLIGVGKCTEAIHESQFAREKDTSFLRAHVAEFVATTRKMAA